MHGHLNVKFKKKSNFFSDETRQKKKECVMNKEVKRYVHKLSFR